MQRTRAMGRRRAGSLGRLMAFGIMMSTAATAMAAGPNTGKLSLSIGNDFTTAYFFRGIMQEREGFITQPYLEIGWNLFSAEEGALTSFSVFGGNWNSLHENQTLHVAGSGPANWYESDYYAGAKATLYGALELKAAYYALTYPGGAFKTSQEVDLTASLNDSQWLGKFALYPSVLYVRETENTALGKDLGNYMEFNVRPSFTILESDTYPVSLAVPMTVGVGLSNYYEIDTNQDDNFGFFKGGLVFSVPLAFIPSDYGTWSASAGAAAYAFGTNLTKYNRGDTPWVVGTWSINMSY